MSAQRQEQPAPKKHLHWMERRRDGLWHCKQEGCYETTTGFNQPVERSAPTRGHLKLVED